MKKILKNEYVNNKKSIPEISKEFNLCLRTIWTFLKNNDFKFRNFSDSGLLTYKNGRESSISKNSFSSK